MGTTDVIIGYAAIVSTIALLWNIWKWKISGPRITLTTNPNMKIYGDPKFPQDKIYISAKATNKGDKATTITNLGFYHYENWPNRLRRRRTFQAVIANAGLQPLPHVLEPGTIWTGIADQEELEKKTLKKGILICELVLSHSRKAKKIRVHLTK